ncbi:hypothetical protein [Ruminococcus flavefaciens]|nr:hypothetical protein [Ruminococcus flavefaciens]
MEKIEIDDIIKEQQQAVQVVSGIWLFIANATEINVIVNAC